MSNKNASIPTDDVEESSPVNKTEPTDDLETVLPDDIEAPEERAQTPPHNHDDPDSVDANPATDADKVPPPSPSTATESGDSFEKDSSASVETLVGGAMLDGVASTQKRRARKNLICAAIILLLLVGAVLGISFGIGAVGGDSLDVGSPTTSPADDSPADDARADDSPTSTPEDACTDPTDDPTLPPCIALVVGPVILIEGDFFCSPNKRYKFGITSNGDLALFESSRRIWSANTSCTGEEVTATLHADGNLAVKTSSSKVLWSSQSSSVDTDIASLLVGDDGIVTITDTKMGHVWSSAVNDKDRVVPDSLEAKIMAGYQGWFFAQGDGAVNQWVHWTRGYQVPNNDTITVDAWPDLRELDDDELYPTGLRYKNGSTAGLYSAYNTKTVERHTRWMKDYGVDGVFVQRFLWKAVDNDFGPAVDKVLANVRSGTEKYGRTFVTMYDISDGNEQTIVQDLINDWKHLVDDEHITKSKQYLHHHGRPLVAIWGFGSENRPGTPEQAAEIIDWFKNTAESKYKVTLMGGVPTDWREPDSKERKKGAEWASIYRSYDVISPWSVTRYVDIQTANYFRSTYIEPDMAECKVLGIDYLPVVFPGFSVSNLKPWQPFNKIPRNGGTFMWHQMYNAIAAGNRMIYVAMFDEVDEGTAIFKLAQDLQQTPTEGRFLTTNFDQGYSNCPNDWYLNITGTVAGLLHQGKDVPLNMPAYP